MADPISDVLVDGQPVAKGDFRAYENTRNRVRLADADAVAAADLTAVSGIDVDGIPYDRLAGDTTSPASAGRILIDGAGNRFHRVINAIAEFDAYGDFGGGDRDAYDSEADGFTFYALDQEGWYVRLGATPGVWSALQPFRGPRGGGRVDLSASPPEGVRPFADQRLLRHVFTAAVTFAGDFASSRAVAGVAATAQAVFVVERNGSQVGTITFAAAGTIGTFATTGGAPVTFDPGDIIDVYAPASPDATLADLAITVSGTVN